MENYKFIRIFHVYKLLNSFPKFVTLTTVAGKAAAAGGQGTRHLPLAPLPVSCPHCAYACPPATCPLAPLCLLPCCLFPVQCLSPILWCPRHISSGQLWLQLHGRQRQQQWS